MNRQDIYKQITDKIVEKLKEGTLPWRKSWKSGLPMNLISKRPYNGINFLSLLTNDYPSPYYLTFLQCKEKNGIIRAGEKGSLVVYFAVKDILVGEEETRRFPLIRYSYVFNISQTSLWDNSPADETLSKSSCEVVWSSFKHKPELKHNISRCYYNPVEDYISLPLVTEFSCPDEYYSALFHETIHWTGHSSRLNRQGDYAFEELVAEIGSSYLCGMCGIEQGVLDNQASYIDGWLKHIKDNPNALILAAKDAQRAVEYLNGQINTSNSPFKLVPVQPTPFSHQIVHFRSAFK